MKFDYKALVNMMIMARVKENSPVAGKVFNAFLKRGISITDAMEILLELVTLIEEMKKEEEEKGE